MVPKIHTGSEMQTAGRSHPINGSRAMQKSGGAKMRRKSKKEAEPKFRLYVVPFVVPYSLTLIE